MIQTESDLQELREYRTNLMKICRAFPNIGIVSRFNLASIGPNAYSSRLPNLKHPIIRVILDEEQGQFANHQEPTLEQIQDNARQAAQDLTQLNWGNIRP